MDYLNVAEIFEGIDGEVNLFHQGRQTVFLRLAGCSLRCKFCDTKKFQDKNSGIKMSIEEVVNVLLSFKTVNLTITGGEPLEQSGGIEKLLRRLRGHYHFVSIETNGAMPIKEFPLYVNYVIDYKLMESERSKMLESNWAYNDSNIIKIVVPGNSYIGEAIKAYYHIRSVSPYIKIAFSVGWHNNLEVYKTNAVILMDMLKRAEIKDAILNVQLHKLLNIK